MFKDPLVTKISSPAGVSMFENKIRPHLHPDFYPLDASIYATMVALFKDRVDEENPLDLHYYLTTNPDVKHGVGYLNNILIDDCELSEINSITIINTYRFPTEAVKSLRENPLDGFVELTKIGAFFEGAFPIVEFINNTSHKAVVICSTTNYREWHYLQSAMFAMLPWLIADKKPTAEEIDFCKSLQTSSPTKWKQYIEKIESDLDFDSARIRRELSAYEGFVFKRQYERTTADITARNAKLESYMLSISDLLSEIETLKTKSIGLLQRIDSVENSGELMNYFLHNKNLYFDYVDNGQVWFVVKTKLVNYDTDVLDTYLKNERSLIYTNSYGFSDKVIKKFLEMVFKEEKYQINTCARFLMKEDGIVAGSQRCSFENASANNYMPNPHIFEYGCLGSYNNIIAQIARESKDYILIIEQCVASTGSLDFKDGAVLPHFMKYVLSTYKNKTVMTDKDGNLITPAQVLKNIEEELRNEE